MSEACGVKRERTGSPTRAVPITYHASRFTHPASRPLLPPIRWQLQPVGGGDAVEEGEEGGIEARFEDLLVAPAGSVQAVDLCGGDLAGLERQVADELQERALLAQHRDGVQVRPRQG